MYILSNINSDLILQYSCCASWEKYMQARKQQLELDME